jgi:5'-nucleotidase
VLAHEAISGLMRDPASYFKKDTNVTHILVTNDDGVHAPGLLALVQALRQVAEVTVLAPDRNWSASGHVKTLERPLRVRQTHLADGSLAYASDGAPSDCVALALLGLFDQTYDLVAAGINPNANIGHDVTYSGTVTAAMEAAIAGVPGVAISLHAPEADIALLDFTHAALYASQIISNVLRNPHPADLLLNVNVPYLPEKQIKGFCITRQGQRIYNDELVTRFDPRNRPYYWIGGESPTGVDENGTDFGAITAGYVSITPLKLDLTDDQVRQVLDSWNWKG